MILGLGNLSLLSQELLTILRTHKILYLYQAKNQNAQDMILYPWKTNVDLGVTGPLAMEWTCYTRVLCGSGIHLCPGEDRLLWMGGDQLGTLTTKNVYNDVAARMWTQQLPSWRNQIWTWDLGYKLKLFFWMVVEDKTLTWDILQTRGWIRSGRCSICFRKVEFISHLFVDCCFTRIL
jgi:hypothetical protein